MDKGGRPRTRPPVTDPAACARLCRMLENGIAMRIACLQQDVPSETEVYETMAKDVGFRSFIARAREVAQHAIIDETVAMADAATTEDWQVVKLRIWARQWRAGKIAPKVYGDKVTQEITGADGGPVTIEAVRRIIVDPKLTHDG